MDDGSIEMPPKAPRLTPEDRRTLKHLRELIQALDRRVPQIESAGELKIARDAAGVRNAALDRISQIQEKAGLVGGDPAARPPR